VCTTVIAEATSRDPVLTREAAKVALAIYPSDAETASIWKGSITTVFSVSVLLASVVGITTRAQQWTRGSVRIVGAFGRAISVPTAQANTAAAQLGTHRE